MRYAGFFSRAVAMVVDACVLMPFGLLFMWTMTLDGPGWLFASLVLAAVGPAYPIWFHARSGQTLGKRFMDIRVVKLGGERISWREACWRSSVDVAFAVAQTAATLITIRQLVELPPDISWYERSELLAEHGPAWAKLLSHVGLAWAFSELVVLLFNAKRRAVHDFIAGTVVVHDVYEAASPHHGSPVASAQLGAPSPSSDHRV